LENSLARNELFFPTGVYISVLLEFFPSMSSSNSDFDYYQEPGCFAQNKQSYSGVCNNIQKDSGLLVIFPDEFKPWTTKVTVNLYEK